MLTVQPQAVTSSPAPREVLEAQFATSKDLRSLLIADGQYDGIRIPGCNLDALDLRRTVFQDSHLEGATLRNVLGVRAIFTKAILSGSDLKGSDFRDASFNSANLEGADLRGCSFSAGTSLKNAIVRKAKIDRQALRMLGANRGGLTEGDIASMEIHDDLVKLTTGFGGFWSLLRVSSTKLSRCDCLSRSLDSPPCSPCVVTGVLPTTAAKRWFGST